MYVICDSLFLPFLPFIKKGGENMFLEICEVIKLCYCEVEECNREAMVM